MKTTPLPRFLFFRKISKAASLIPTIMGLKTSVAFFPPRTVFLFPSSEIEEFYNNVNHVFVYRDYERFADFIPRRCWRIADIGAYVGLYSYRASILVGKCGRVAAYEANPTVYYYLKRNIDLNGLGNVSGFNLAVAKKRGYARLYIGSSLVNSSVNAEYVSHMSRIVGSTTVRCVGLDDVIEAFQNLDLMKIDVEGVEGEIIKNSKKLYPERVHRIVVEVHEPFTETSELMDILEKRGYDLFAVSSWEHPNQVFVYATGREFLIQPV